MCIFQHMCVVRSISGRFQDNYSCWWEGSLEGRRAPPNTPLCSRGFESGGSQATQLRQRHRLGQVVVDAEALHGGVEFGGAVGGDQDDPRAKVVATNALDQL